MNLRYFVLLLIIFSGIVSGLLVNPNTNQSTLIKPSKPKLVSDNNYFQFKDRDSFVSSYNTKHKGPIQPSININKQEIKTMKTTADLTADEVIFNQQYTISGKLTGGVGDPWDGEIVRLEVDNVDTGQTDTTTAAGDFTFTLSFTSADIGSHAYAVIFDGDLPLREAGTAKTGSFAVYDSASWVISADTNNVGPNTVYTFTVAVTALSGASLQNLELAVDEQYGIDQNTQEYHAVIDGNIIVDALGQASLSKTYGLTSHWPNGVTTDTMSFTVSVANPNSFNTTVFPVDETSSNLITVTSSFSFDFTVSVNNTLTTDILDRQYRLNQTIFMQGDVNNQSNVGTAQDLINAIANKSYTITITGAGYSLGSLTGVTNSTGGFSRSLILNTTAFSDINSDTISIDGTVTGVSNLATNSVTRSFKLKEDLNIMSANTTMNASIYYHPGSSSFTVFGNVKDVHGNNASGVPIILSINNKTKVNDPWGLNVTSQQIGSTTTNPFGNFSFIINDFNFLFSTAKITLNVTIGNTDPNPDTIVWSNINLSSFTIEVGTFLYYSSIQTNFQVSLNGTTTGLTNLQSGTIDVFNDTFASYFTNGAYYNVTIRDEFGRIPVDLFVNFTGINKLFGFVIDEGFGKNNGTFVVTLQSLNSTITDLTVPDTTYSFFISVANNVPQLKISKSETYKIYGPDTVPPSILGSTYYNQGSPDPVDVTVNIEVDFTKSAFDNIRNVTIYYRYSNNADAFIQNVTFGSYIIDSMTWNATVGFYQFVFPFQGHGIWVQWYVVIYDKAGFGLLLNGNTNSTGYDGWDHSVSLNDSLGSASTQFEFKMGDTDIIDNSFDIANAIKINNQDLDQSTNVTIGDDITIDLYLPVDNSGNYSYVEIHWQYLTYDVSGNLLVNSSFIIANMTDFGINGGLHRFNYLINGSIIGDWFTEINYFFVVQDQAGNQYVSPQINKLKQSNPNVVTTWIQDEVQPEDPNPTRISNYPITSGNRTVTATNWEAWNANETAIISYNITDTGTGMYNITLVYYFYDSFGNLTTFTTDTIIVNNTIGFYNGTTLNWFIQGINQTNQNIFNVTMFIDFNGLGENSSMSWSIFTSDIANNTRIINPQGVTQNPITFTIKNPPEPEVQVPTSLSFTTSQIITTDSAGNTVTINTIVPIAQEKKSNNAAFIIIGFIFGLALLTLYYQRHNIKEIYARRARARRARGTLSELTDEIKRLGAEGHYKKAIKLTWEALERISREIIQVPRAYNQTAREFASYLSTVTIVDRETLLTLSSTYEKAKYGKDDPTHDDWDDAVKALDITVTTIIESGIRVEIDEDEEDF